MAPSMPNATSSATKSTQAAPKASPSTSKVSTPAPTPVPKATPKPVTQPTAPAITGYGATQSDWDKNHQADSRYDSGSVYNATPGLGLDDQHNDKYYEVSAQNGRILTYEMRLPNQSSLTIAKAEVMQEFPSDAQVIWQKTTAGQCSQMEISSATLGNAAILGSSAIGDPQGQVFVEFQTDSASSSSLNSYYDASNVNLATLNLGSYNTAADAPGC